MNIHSVNVYTSCISIQRKDTRYSKPMRCLTCVFHIHVYYCNKEGSLKTPFIPHWACSTFTTSKLIQNISEQNTSLILRSAVFSQKYLWHEIYAGRDMATLARCPQIHILVSFWPVQGIPVAYPRSTSPSKPREQASLTSLSFVNSHQHSKPYQFS